MCVLQVNGTLRDGSDADLAYEPSPNFQDGVGDPYFGGKMLAKMAYIAVIASHTAMEFAAPRACMHAHA